MADPIGIGLAVAVGVAVWWYAEKKQRLGKAPDAQVIAQLKKAGSDLSRPHDIEFFFFGGEEESMKSLSKSLRKTGLDVEINSIEGQVGWCVKASKSMIPSIQELEAHRSDFTSLAQKYNAVYDGWGAGVIE